MIIDYDRRPNATEDEKLQSLVENIQLALNSIDAGTLTGEVTNNIRINAGTLNGTIDGDYLFVKNLDADSITAVKGWIDKLLVQTHLLANEGEVFELDAIQVNASRIKTGTLDVERLIYTNQTTGEKYLVHFDPDGSTTYEKLDGNVIEDLTITADKIVSESIMARHITTQNLEGTGGWINLRNGTFFYGNGATYAAANNAISWDGSKLKIKADDFELSSGKSIFEEIEAIETWFYAVAPTTTNEPAKNWNTEKLKELHLRDIYFDTTSGKSYRWAKEGTTYKWVEIEDVELAAVTRRLSDAETSITKNADSIVSLASANETYVKPDGTTVTNPISSSIKQQADRIGLVVKNADASSSLELTANAMNYIGGHVEIKDSSGTSTVIAGGKIKANAITADEIDATDLHVSAAHVDGKLEASQIKVEDITIKAAQIGSGTIDSARIPNLSADKITTGDLSADRIKTNVIGAINNNTGTVKIDASKVEIDGTVTFNAIKASADAAYDSKGAASAVQTNLDNLEIGGRNLLLNTAQERVSPASSSGSAYAQPQLYLSDYGKSVLNNTTDEWTYSFDYEVTGNSATNAYVYAQIKGSTATASLYISGHEVGHFTKTFTLTETQVSSTSNACNVRLRNATDGAVLTVRNAKLEKGNRATDWTPAPEDVQAEIDAKKSIFTVNATGTDASQSYAQILAWAEEGKQLTWAVDSTAGIKAGDTVRVKTTVSNMSNAPVYVVTTCRETPTSSTSIKTTSHGLDTTIIDGGNILTNSIGANQIASNAITTDELATNAVSIGKLDTSTQSKLANRLGNISKSWSQNADTVYVELCRSTIACNNSSASGSVHISGTIGGYVNTNQGRVDVTIGCRNTPPYVIVGQKDSTINTTYGNILAYYDSNYIVHVYLVKRARWAKCNLDLDTASQFELVNVESSTAPSGTKFFDLSTATTEDSRTATTYITDIGNDGIRVHDSHTTNNSVVINSDGMEVFKGGTGTANSVAKYGDTARIGKSGQQRVEVTSSAVEIHDANGAVKLKTTANGLDIYGNESTTNPIAQFTGNGIICGLGEEWGVSLSGAWNDDVQYASVNFGFGDSVDSYGRVGIFTDGGVEFYSPQNVNIRSGSNRVVINAWDYIEFASQDGFINSGPNRVLWNGTANYMGSGQSITLSDNVSNQLTGIVLAWSRYADGAAQNDSWFYQFVPKWHVSAHSGNGIHCSMPVSNTSNTVCNKYVYITDTKITGHADNTKTGTGYANNARALRAVLGV